MSKKPPPPPPTYAEARVVKDPYAVVRGPFLGKWLVLGRTFHGVRAIGRQLYAEGATLGVVHRTIHDQHLRHYPEDENTSLQSFLAGIKEEMLTHGATALAVQWVLEFEPAAFTEKELNTMADKLKGKGAPAKKTETKAPAKGKGNPEALEKARAARAEANAGPDKRKISVLKKPHGARDGTTRANLLDTIYKSKTVQDAIDAGVKKSDVSWAARAEYISIG